MVYWDHIDRMGTFSDRDHDPLSEGNIATY
jgi:hypothetical protein